MIVPGESSSAVPPLFPIERSPQDRSRDDGLSAIVREPGARVLLLRGDLAPLAAGGEALDLVAADELFAAREVLAARGPGGALMPAAFLGRDAQGPLLLALMGDEDPDPVRPAGGWADFRTVGGELRADARAVLVEALALSRWIEDAAFCPACGAPAQLRHAGWSRHCHACGREHFPRTEPAVIVAITDGARLLLGSNALWPEGRYSCFAGFVEAGESAEECLVREVEEEAGVQIDTWEYLGSQAWPYPRSLMLGYLATITDAHRARPDGEEIVDVRWFDAPEIAAALAGEGDITLPGASSLSRVLIERWLARAAPAS